MRTKKLSIEERERIFYYLSQVQSYREIGQHLNRCHTTISRKIKNNMRVGEYSPKKNIGEKDIFYLKVGNSSIKKQLCLCLINNMKKYFEEL
jgi:IS30 family transposase